MDNNDEQLLLGHGPGPALVLYDIEGERWVTAAAMGNGVNREGDGSSSSGSDTVTPAQARESKFQRINSCNGRPQAHQDTAQPVLPGRRCFVTVGATAGFAALLEEVSTPGFLQCLGDHGYRFLDVQCGPDVDLFHQRISNLSDEEKGGVSVLYFGYTPDMQGYILGCRGEENVRPAGCVISHGGKFNPNSWRASCLRRNSHFVSGTGTVSEVLAVGAPLIVVANPTLMDNHQLELAQSLEEQDQAIHGRIGYAGHFICSSPSNGRYCCKRLTNAKRNLASAIHRMAGRITEGTLDALPPYSPPPFPVAAADRITLFDWMVLTCYPEELAAQEHLADLREAEIEFAEELEQQQMVNGNYHPTLATSAQVDNILPQLD
jgi:beta-1,4-N-acetylglucosaminyltransferase